ncbi:MAG: hypothetical protein JSR50_11805 [Proteobacteria bacterium]|nr:hypothetical protein [Pseudomonadota bacterium]
MRHILLAPLMRWFGRLSYPRLFLLLAALFLFDTLIPDFIPFIDEILLGLGTLILARMKKKDPATPQAGNTTPPVEGTATRR